MSERTYFKRTFLNDEKDGGTAFIKAEVEEREFSPNDRHGNVLASITIGDCNRRVDLDFSIYFDRDSPDDARDRLANLRRKAALLKRTFNNFTSALNEELDQLEAML